VKEHEAFLTTPSKATFVRGHAGQLYAASITSPGGQAALTITRYSDAVPEIPTNYTLTYEGTGVNFLGLGSPNVHVHSSNEIDVFFLRGRDSGGPVGVDTWEVCQVRSDNSGYGFVPRVTGPFDPAANLKVTGVNYLGVADVYYAGVKMVCPGDYTQLRTLYSRSGQLIVFGYRSGTWYMRTCQLEPDGTWDASNEVEVFDTGDSTCEDARETGDGVFSFLCCDDAGMLQLIRADEGVAKDGTSNWVPDALLDAYAAEYFSYSVYLESGGRRAVAAAWKPVQLGRVWDGPTHQGGWNSLGNIYIVLAEKEDNGSWVLHPEKLAFGSNLLAGPMYLSVYKRKDGQYQIHGPGNRKAYLDFEGNGTWVVT
jgi:hypothetical protein